MSYSQYLKGRAIQTGTEWRLKIQISSSALAAFPADATFAAQIRRNVDDAEPLASLTTAAGNIIRVSNNSIEIILPAATSKDWISGKVFMDVIRTDQLAPVHLGFDLEIPVKRSITRI